MYSNPSFPRLPRQFTGKWHRNTYTVQGELGRGANGVVYLVSHLGKKMALKAGHDSLDLLMEVNLLKTLQRNREKKVGPLLWDVDDVVIDGKTHPFYAMEYVQGEQIDQYVQRVGGEWVPVLMIQLLSHLEVLHQNGYVFGDLKPENAMVMTEAKQVCLIDFGGVSKIGNAVRQFTEEYDRAYWMAGDRRADVGYDLFALAIMMMRLSLGREEWKRIGRSRRHPSLLCDIIQDNENLYSYSEALRKALFGKHLSAQGMKAEMLLAFRQGMDKQATRPKKGKDGKWISGMFVASLLLLACSLYLVWM